MAKVFVAPTHLVWIDLEMTGLDVAVNRIVEAAVVVTDADLNILGDGGMELIIHQPEGVLKASNAFAIEAFTASGLYDKVRASTLSEEKADARIVEYIKSLGVPEKTSPLCGNTISQDRKFIEAQMPRLQDYLHYRNLDVSSPKMVVGMWLPKIFEGAPEKAEGHRALDDILESIEELRYYREHALVKP